jgi:hypothetical protein
MFFLQQLSKKNLGGTHQPQTIVVESRANKCHESKAKFNNNLLKVLLVGSNTDLSPPGTFAMPRIPFYTQAMKIILAQPTLV